VPPKVQKVCSGIQKKGDAKGLERLSLWGCGIGDEEVKALMAVLRDNVSRLKGLILLSNSIGDAGAMAMAESCHSSPDGCRPRRPPPRPRGSLLFYSFPLSSYLAFLNL